MRKAQTTDYKPVRRLLAEQAAAFGDKPYMVSIDQDEKALSYRDLWRLGNRMAHFFRARGLTANDRVLMLSENSNPEPRCTGLISRCTSPNSP